MLVLFIVVLVFLFPPSSVADVVVKGYEIRKAQEVKTELCEVVEHEAVIRSTHANIRIAVIKRSDGRLQEIHLDNIGDRTSPPISKIPSEVKYVFATGLNDSGISPASIVLVHPK